MSDNQSSSESDSTLIPPIRYLTIFHLFVMIGAISGLIFGLLFGLKLFGVLGGALGVFVGIFVGSKIGGIPFALTSAIVFWNLRRTDTATLRLRLETDLIMSRFIIAELLRRGEPAESFREYISGLLTSDSGERRWYGEDNRLRWLPEMEGLPHSKD